LQNLIVGTGPTATAAAFALRRRGMPFEVLDVANDLEQERETLVGTLAGTQPSDWNLEHVGTLFPPPTTSARGGVERRFSFGSDFPYRRSEFLSCTTSQCTVDLSNGLGGFGNVWGAAILPSTGHDLSDWPISLADLAGSYKNVSQFVPASAESDDLEGPFPLYQTGTTPLARSEQTENILRALAMRRNVLKARGTTFGRSRLAVDSSGGSSTCRYCGYCLDGCAYGSIFSPRTIWKKFELEGIVIHKGFYALEFQESSAGVTLSAVDVRDGSVRRWHASRLFLGLGTIGTTRLIARSIKLINKPIRIQDSQYFFFPLLSYRKARDLAVRFTLADVFVEIQNPRISRNYVHFQVYGLNEIFRQTLRSIIPSPFRHRFLLGPVESRFYLFQGFLHSADSSHMELTITSSQFTRDQIDIRGVEQPAALRVAKRAQALLRRSLAGFGLIPPLYLTMVPPGRSFHAGGSFPMGAKDPIYTSDLLGRPAGLKRIHVLDATTFPSIPATTITYTAMANADRVINEVYRNGSLI
jgi:ferredoxin